MLSGRPAGRGTEQPGTPAAASGTAGVWQMRARALIASTRGGLAANVALLAGGTALGQALTVVSSPVLTRLYGPEDLGRLGLYMAFVNVAVVATSLRYDDGIVATPTVRQAALLTLVAVGAVFPMSVLLSLGLLVLIHYGWLGYEALPPTAALLVLVSLVTTGATSALRYWFIRQEAFALLAGILVWQNGVRAAAQIGLGAIGLGWSGLLLGDIAGRLVGVGRFTRLGWSTLREDVLPIDWQATRAILSEYRKLPIFDLPSSLIDTLAVSLTIPLVSQVYGTQAAGYVSLVLSVETLPVGLVGRSVADVFHARMAQYARDASDQVVRFFLTTSGLLLMVGLIPAVLLIALAPLVFPWLFGPAWATAGHLAAQMAPWALAGLVVSPVSRVVVIFQAQELKLIYDVLALAGVLVPVAAGGWLRLDLLDTVKLLTLAQVASYGLYFVLLLYVVRGARAGADQARGRA